MFAPSRSNSNLGGGFAASKTTSASVAPLVDPKKEYVETEAFKRRRGDEVRPAAGTTGGSRSSSRGTSVSPTRSAPAAVPVGRWVWTDAGFGQVIQDTRAVREEARAKEIAASFAPSSSSSSSASSSSSSSSSIVAPLPQAAAAASILSPAPSDANGVPQAPPASSSPSTSLNSFLSLIASPPKASSAAAPAAPSSSYSSYSSAKKSASGSSSNLDSMGGAAASTLVLTLPTLPAPASTAHVAPSCMEEHVAVHLLPHFAAPTAPQTPAASSSSSSSSSSAAAPSSFGGGFGASFGLGLLDDASTPTLGFSALPPTIIYTPASGTHSTIRVRIRTFMDLAATIPKKKPSTTGKDGSSSSSGSGSGSGSSEGNGPGFAQLLGAEIKARREKGERDRMMKDMSPAQREAFEREEAVKKAAAQAKAEKDEQDKKNKSEAPPKPKPTGPPPQEITLEVPVGESIRGLMQKIMEFYAEYGAELDPDSMRLVANGVEISKSNAVTVSTGIVVTAAAAAAAEAALAEPKVAPVVVAPAAVVAAAPAAAPAAAASSDAAPASLMPPAAAPAAAGAGAGGASAADEKQNALLERLSKMMSMVLNNVNGNGGSSGGGGGFASNNSPAAIAALQQAQALVVAAQQSGSKLDASTKKMLKEAMALMLPGGLNGLGGGIGRGGGGAAAAALSKAQQPSQTDKERFFRSHTMLAECGLVPLRTVGAATAVAAAEENPAALSPAASSSSSSSSRPLPPLFPLLLVYDELSRFSWDAASLSPELVLSADGLGVTMTLSDNKWQTVRSLNPFTAGRHMWKIKMERCAGGNVFLGVCNASMKLNNYIGSDSNGYGFYGCGNIYRSGASSSFGQSYRSGDTITCKLDMDARTLSFEKNDQPLGVAFTDLPESLHPAMSLYTKNDFIQITEFGTF